MFSDLPWQSFVRDPKKKKEIQRAPLQKLTGKMVFTPSVRRTSRQSMSMLDQRWICTLNLSPGDVDVDWRYMWGLFGLDLARHHLPLEANKTWDVFGDVEASGQLSLNGGNMPSLRWSAVWWTCMMNTILGGAEHPLASGEPLVKHLTSTFQKGEVGTKIASWQSWRCFERYWILPRTSMSGRVGKSSESDWMAQWNLAQPLRRMNTFPEEEQGCCSDRKVDKKIFNGQMTYEIENRGFLSR